MAHIALARPAAPMAGTVTTGLARIVATILAWNDTRVTRKQLSRLTARELDDIGLCAADIDAVARRRLR